MTDTTDDMEQHSDFCNEDDPDLDCCDLCGDEFCLGECDDDYDDDPVTEEFIDSLLAEEEDDDDDDYIRHPYADDDHP